MALHSSTATGAAAAAAAAGKQQHTPGWGYHHLPKHGQLYHSGMDFTAIIPGAQMGEKTRVIFMSVCCGFGIAPLHPTLSQTFMC